MADRVLPSREAFEGLQHEPMIDGHLPPGWRTVLREFGSGRLVDREALDRRAAQIAVAEGISDHISTADDWEEWAAEALALVDLCLDAALRQV